MKSINSKKARKEIGDLICDLQMYSEWTSTEARDSNPNYRYHYKHRCECIVELQEVYGIPSIYYENSKKALADPFWSEATHTFYKEV